MSLSSASAYIFLKFESSIYIYVWYKSTFYFTFCFLVGCGVCAGSFLVRAGDVVVRAGGIVGGIIGAGGVVAWAGGISVGNWVVIPEPKSYMKFICVHQGYVFMCHLR